MEIPGERIPNPRQRAVIEELDRNLILYASAGTGKTFTVAKRVAHILESGAAVPERILCLTFTLRAAGEMQSDILRYAGDEGKKVSVRTIHGFAYQVIREEALRQPGSLPVPGICDETDEAQMLRDLLGRINPSEGEAIPIGDQELRSFVSTLKHEREWREAYTENEAEDFQRLYRELTEAHPGAYPALMPRTRNGKEKSPLFTSLMKERAGELLHGYQELLRQSSLADFDDLICQCRRIFRDEKALANWKNRYSYIIMDEMQDTSEMEYDFIRRLFPGNHAMLCGDIFQTIYQWRGSNPEKILSEYIRDFGAKSFWLSENYRSTVCLTRASFGYLKNSFSSLMGDFFPGDIEIHSREEGEKILNLRCADLRQEALLIDRFCEAHGREDPSRVCVMTRSNASIKALSEALNLLNRQKPEENRLSFLTVDQEVNFFRTPLVKDILAVLRLLLNPADLESIKRIAGKYSRGITEKLLNQLQEDSRLGLSLHSCLDEKSYRDGDPYACLMRASGEGKIVVYDTETTGLDLSRDQIIQLSAIRLNGKGEILDTLDQMVIPGVPISPEAQATHHQSLQDILRKGGIEAGDALKRFSDFAEDCVLVGHNSRRFDAPLIRRQLREWGLPPLPVRGEYDTLEIARQFLPHMMNYKLDTLCTHYGIVNECAHDALGDITATGRVMQRLLEENIIPSTALRREKLRELLPPFRKFYDFLSGLRKELGEGGDLRALTEKLAEQLRLFSRYPESRQSIEDFLRIAERESSLEELLANASLSSGQMDVLMKKTRKIPIITVHQSKGLEFDCVVLADADDQHFPIGGTRDCPEEEKRVFYVAISRAKKNLCLISRYQTQSPFGEKLVLPQSRLISGIPGECIRHCTLRDVGESRKMEDGF